MIRKIILYDRYYTVVLILDDNDNEVWFFFGFTISRKIKISIWFGKWCVFFGGVYMVCLFFVGILMRFLVRMKNKGGYRVDKDECMFVGKLLRSVGCMNWVSEVIFLFRNMGWLRLCLFENGLTGDWRITIENFFFRDLQLIIFYGIVPIIYYCLLRRKAVQKPRLVIGFLSLNLCGCRDRIAGRLFSKYGMIFSVFWFWNWGRSVDGLSSGKDGNLEIWKMQNNWYEFRFYFFFRLCWRNVKVLL